MISKTFSKMRQCKKLSFIKMSVTVLLMSLLPTVICTDFGVVTKVLSNSTVQNEGSEFPHILSNNTLHAFKRHDRSNTDVLGLKDSKNNSEYLVAQDVSQNTSEVTQEDTSGSGDVLGDLLTQAFAPGDGTNGLEWLQNVYNPHLWGRSPPGELDTKCRADIKQYLAALNNGTVWAAKSKYVYVHSFYLFLCCIVI